MLVSMAGKTGKTGKKKTDKVKYGRKSVTSQTLALVRRSVNATAITEEKVQQANLEKRVVKLVVHGHSVDIAAHKCGIDAVEANRILRDTLAKWRTEQALSTTDLQEVMVRQYDAVLALSMHEAFPHPLKDDQGRPVMVKRCTCPPQEDGLCLLADHNEQAMSTPDRAWADMVLSVLERKDKLLGLGKLEQTKVDALRRIYEGVPQSDIDKL